VSYRNRKKRSVEQRTRARAQRPVPKSLKDLERALKPRQMFALRHPVPVGASELPRDARHERVQVIGATEWHVRTLFDMNGAPELLGPC